MMDMLAKVTPTAAVELVSSLLTKRIGHVVKASGQHT